MSSPRLRDAHRCQGDEGSVVAEFALCLPLIMVVLVGIFEFGFMFRQQIEFSNSVQAAARVGSHAGKARNADQLALASLAMTLTGLPNTTVNKVWIYKSTNTDGTLPSTCNVNPASGGAGVNSVCNVYSWSQVQGAAAGTGFDLPTASTCGTSTFDRYWCPLNRADSIIAAGGPDQFGIQVEVTYRNMTNMIGSIGTRTMKERATFRVEALDR
jgi:hypothetical protein